MSEVKALNWFSISAIVEDMNEEKIIGKLEAHDKRFDTLETKLESHDKQLDLLAAKALEHDKRFDVLEVEVGEVKKLSIDVKKLSLKVLTALDENTALLRDKRQEQEATSATLVGHGKAIENHEERIMKLEPKPAV